ncbi:MAG: translocation/assembly module TamB domain-containing protein [Bacteriovoracaceae bacterium]
MRKLNKILLLFIGIIFVALLAIWEFLQSDMFGKNLSKTVNKVTKSQFGAAINFENLSFQLFPPGANLNSVSIELDRPGMKAEAKLGKLGVYFNLIDSFQTKLTIKELFVEDGVIEIAGLEKNKGSSTEALSVSSAVEALENSLPVVVRRAFAKDVMIKYGKRKQFINMAAISLRQRGVSAKADIRNIDLKQFVQMGREFDREIDQVKFEALVLDKRIDLKNIEIKQGINSAQAKGEIKNYLERPVFDLTGSLLGEIGEAGKRSKLKVLDSLHEGILAGRFQFKGTIEDYILKTALDVKKFKTEFAYGDKLSMKLAANKESIILEQASLSAGDQHVVLQAPFEIYNFKRNGPGNKIVLKAKKLKLSNALRYLGDTLDPLQGVLSGKITASFHKNSIEIFSEEEVALENFKLFPKGAKKPILQTKSLSLIRPVFSLENGDFRMNSAARVNKTFFKVTGGVKEGQLDFSVKNGIIDLKELGPFAGFKLRGVGAFDLSAKGSGLNTELTFKSDLKDFEFEGYKLDKFKSNVLFDFKNSSIVIGSFGGNQGKASLVGEAKVNYETLDVKANGELATKRYSDAKKMLGPLLGDLDAIPIDLFGSWNMEVVVGGKATAKDLRVNGVFRGRNNYIFDEGFEFAGFNLLFEKEKLSINDILLRKSTGKIKGSFSYSLPESATSYSVDIQSLPVSEVTNYAKTPFAFNADLSGKVVGVINKNGQSALVDLNLLNTNLSGKNYENSSVSFALADNEIDFEFNLLGEEVSSRGKVFLEKGAERSNVELLINSQDAQKPLSLLKFVDRSSLNIEGKVNLRANAKFDGLDFKNSDLSVNLRQFALAKDRLNLKYVNGEGPQIIVEEGDIKRWDIELKGQRVYLISKGEGSFRSRYDIDNQFKIDASFFEVFNAVISQAGGTIRARARFFKNFFTQDYQATLVSDDLSISSDKIPTEINAADFKVSYKDKKLELESLKAQLSAGSISARGEINFENIIPDIDLRINLNDAGFPILKKSNVVVSGEAHLSGNKMPYSLTGEARIQKLLIMNEITDFKGSSDSIFKKEFDYLPEQVSALGDNFVNMNIDVATVEPIMLNNSIADVGVVGDAQIIGGEEDFRMVGTFSLAPRKNKISFKNNEYSLTKANIFFYERSKIANPELDIAAYSVINNYRVNIKVYGPVDDFNLELGSEPALAQEDVLSLIAFGYTEDLSANLSDQEKESMTRAGVGSIIFDSFKINETLKNEFGLQVNLGTEISEEQRSYLSRVNNDSSVGRVRSATTIEVKKKLNDAMNLSVTSTMGGSISQKQSMNLNYNISNKLSVEGVYETRTSDEGGETINDSSLGADVKIRWSFR